MRRIVIATHGKMASGIKTTLEIILGPQEELICIDAYTEECTDPLPEFKKVLSEYPNDEIVIMTDMMGGSVNNNAMVLTGEDRIHVVTGINLAVVISIVMADKEQDTKELIKEAISSSREMIIYCNEIEHTSIDEDDDF